MFLTKTATFAAALAATFLLATHTQAEVLLSDDFDDYTNSALAGQGGWTVATVGDGSISVVNGKVVVSTAVNPTTTTIVLSPSFTGQTNVFYGIDVTFTDIPNTTDYNSLMAFRSGSNNRAATSIRGSWDSGNKFTLVNNSATQLSKNYSATYRLIAQYESGTAARYWIGEDANSLVEITPYYSTGSGGGTYGSFALFNTGNVGVVYDNLVIATTFAEVIPEPGNLALLGLGGLCLLGRRRVM